VLRFQDALRMLMRDDARTLAAVAADAGYFDQAHFIRDFRQMTGGVPRGYRGYFPVDGPADFAPNVVAFVQDRADRPRYQRRRTGRAAPRR
jgi:AraC-like DNA-binding protein